jgi:hypothetical protein
MSRTARAVGAVAVTVALVLALAGCGTAPWQGKGKSPTGTPSASSTPRATVHNDLATGSARHTLHAGDVTLTAEYYSNLDIGAWHPAANKPLSLSVTASLGSDQGQGVYLSDVTMAVTVQGPHGALAAPAVQSDQATVQPGYFVEKPYSYAPTFVIPPIDKRATSIEVSIIYDLLV